MHVFAMFCANVLAVRRIRMHAKYSHICTKIFQNGFRRHSRGHILIKYWCRQSMFLIHFPRYSRMRKSMPLNDNSTAIAVHTPGSP